MRTIIAGSRTIKDIGFVYKAALNCGFDITEIISGGARGIDKLGEEIARRSSIPCKVFPANWDLHGKSAGYKRNVEMAEYADALIAIWDGHSRGTKHMIDIATAKGLLVYVEIVDDQS